MKKIFLCLILITNISFSQWTDIETPYGGRVTSITNNSNIIYIASTSNIFKSTNNGNNWIPIQRPTAMNGTIASIAVGTNGFIYIGYLQHWGSVWKSTDDGNSWVQLKKNTDPFHYVTQIKTIGNNIYVLDKDGGIYYSENNGNVWTNLSYGNGSRFDVDSTGNKLFLIKDGNIYYSSDKGFNWTIKNGYIREFYDVCLNSENQILVLTNSGIYRSNDFGDNWSLLSNHLADKIFAGYNNDIFIKEGINSYFSKDSGLTWSKPALGNYISDILLMNNSYYLAVSRDAILYSNDNGITWQLKNNGINLVNIKDIKIISDSTYLLNSYEYGVSITTDKGNTWKYSLLFSSKNSFDYDSSNNIIYYGQYRSNDYGNTWDTIFNSMVYSISYVSSNSVLIGSDDGIYLTTDNGNNCSHVLNTSYIIDQLAKVNNSLIYALGNKRIYKTTNGGNNWTNVSILNTDYNDGELKTTKDGILFYAGKATAGEGIKRSTDNGKTWVSVRDGDIYNLQIDSFNNIYFSTNKNNGFYYSDDIGNTWNLISSNKNIRNISTINTGYLLVSALQNFSSFNLYIGKIPDVPSLKEPLNYASNLPISLNLEWLNDSNAIKYKLQLATDSLFTQIIVENYFYNTTFNINNLEYYTKYYWRVKSYNIFGAKEYSDIWSFTTQLSPSLLSLPANNSTDVSLIPTLSWNSVTGAASYRLQISTSSDFTSGVVTDDSTLTTTSKQISSLSNNTTYYWRVRATNVGGTSVWSSVFNFTTIDQSTVSVTTNKNWNIISVPVTVANMQKDSLFTTSTSSAFTFKNGYAVADTLQNGKGYWLKFGSNQSLQITGVPVINTTIDVNSGWNLIGCYDKPLVVNQISSTPNNIINSSFFGYNNGYVIPDTLKPGKGYWLKASQSGVLDIGTAVVNSPSYPVSLSKTNGIISTLKQKKGQNWGRIIVRDAKGKSSVLYMGKDIGELNKYELPPKPPMGVFDVRFSSNNTYVEYIGGTKEIDISTDSYPVTISIDNMKGIRIYDKVTGGSLMDKTISEGGKVTIKNKSITKLVLEEKIIPAVFSLEQNYPNPFNPSTTIKYGLPENVKVKLTIYNTLGQRVEEIINQEQEAGYHKIVWHASKYASGVYIYRIEAGRYSNAKKLLLIK